MLKKLIKTVFLTIYKVLALVNLQPAIFVAVLGLIVLLTGSFITYPILKTVFFIALGLSVLYAVIITICKIFGLDTKKKPSKIQIVNAPQQPVNQPATQQIPQQQPAQQPQQTATQPVSTTAPLQQPTYPIYSRVKDHPNLIMAEFSDRYELYKRENGKLIRLRQDYKGR